MKVICINASPIPGSANLNLDRIKEGKEYEVFGVNVKGYDIGIDTDGYWKTYWNKRRFLETSSIDETELVNHKEEAHV